MIRSSGTLVSKTAVTPTVSPAHHAPVTRIQETDALIDQIVYRLYGLTEEEIAVVEERE